MKHLLILLLLCPLSMLAKFYPGTVTMKDGSTRSGFVEPPIWDADKMNFRPSEKGKTEKISIDVVKEVSLTNDDKKVLKYVVLKLAQARMFKAEYKIDKDTSWVLVEKEGKGLNLVSMYENGVNGAGWGFYIHKPGEDIAKYIFMRYDDATIMMMKYKFIEPFIKRNFEKECPELVKAFTEEVFKEKGVTVVVDLYDQYCQ